MATEPHGRTVMASDFKQRCLALLDQVAESGETLTITKHGRPVARVVPVEETADLAGSVEILVDDETKLFSTGEHWEAES
jgi:prevent-host-death family protein